MGIKYYYNLCICELDDTVLDGDILSAVRKSYFDDFDKIRDKITLDSEGEYLLYDYCIEKDKPLRWTVKTADGTLLQEVTPAEGGRYYICFYNDGRLFKRLLFSRLHTLLKVEYTDNSGAVCASLEPRKLRDGLCLLYKSTALSAPAILSEMPEVTDERILERVKAGFNDFTASAATNDGVVFYLTEEQMSSFRDFVAQAEEEISSIHDESFIGDDTPLYDKINAKDFNIKRNLSASLDITKARDFGSPDAAPTDPEEIEADDTEDEAVVIEPVSEYVIAEPVSQTEEAENSVKPDKLIMADGAVYSYYGELDDFGNRSGYGRTVTELGRTAYEGEYFNDKRSGKGAYFYKDGTLCYSGDWSENARHGVGVGVSSRDGSMHIGCWKNNLPEGNGVRVSAEGDIRFVCKELSDGRTVLMNYTDDDSVIISQYDPDGKKIAEKTVSLTNF